jgi:CHAD domain-containing protein
MRTLAHPRTLARRPVRELLAQWPLALVEEVEGIHQTRVASRRLRELVPALARVRDEGEARRLRRGLRAVTRLLGRSRELDVAVETLRAVAVRTEGGRDGADAVRAHIRRERVEAGRDANRQAAAVDAGALVAGVLALAARSQRPAAIRNCARRVAARLGRRAGELEKAVVEAGLMFAPGPLHAVRIALKKFRYGLEVAERLGRFRLAGSMRRLKYLQDLLGELHDLQVLGGLARDVMAQESGSSRRAIEALVTTIDDDIRALHSRFLLERDSIIVLLTRATSVRRTLLSMPAPGPVAGGRERRARSPVQAGGKEAH